MKRLWMLVALVILTAARADDAAQKLTDCMRANFPPSIRIQAMELATINLAGDSRSMKGRVFVMREDEGKDKGLLRTMLKIDEPSNLKGAAYLVRETDDFLRDGMFVYLPSVNRVRRITGEFADGSLMGTDFSYYDFKQLQGAFGDLSGKLEGADKIEERAVQTLSFQPLPNVASPYTSVKVWVDQATCVPLRADFNEGDKVLKRLNASPKALQQSGKFWYLAEIEMQNLGKGTRSVLKLGEVTSGRELSSTYFNPQSFYLGN